MSLCFRHVLTSIITRRTHPTLVDTSAHIISTTSSTSLAVQRPSQTSSPPSFHHPFTIHHYDQHQRRYDMTQRHQKDMVSLPSGRRAKILHIFSSDEFFIFNYYELHTSHLLTTMISSRHKHCSRHPQLTPSLTYVDLHTLLRLLTTTTKLAISTTTKTTIYPTNHTKPAFYDQQRISFVRMMHEIEDNVSEGSVPSSDHMR